MKIITTNDLNIKVLAQMALDASLYQSIHWTLYRCYNEILFHSDIAESSEIILLEDDNGEIVGSVFHNDKYLNHYCYTNIQAYVLPSHRARGFGKLLYKEMNKFLISRNFEGMLYAGSGVEGSITFWDKMSNLHTDNSTDFLPLDCTY